MTTVEGISTKLTEKIELLGKMIEVYYINRLSIDIGLINAYQRIVSNYEFGSMRILSEYYFLDVNSPEYMKVKMDIFRRLVIFIIQENVISNLDSIYYNLKKYSNQCAKNDLLHITMNYEKIKINVSVREKSGFLCECGGEVAFIQKDSDLECKVCFARYTAGGTMLNDDQQNSNEKYVKTNQYQTRRHGKEWLDSICGLEHVDIPPEVIKHINKCALNDRIIDKKNITCLRIRDYLKKNGNMAKYNQHIPRIRKLVTGIEPPQLTEQEMKQFNKLFGKVIDAYNSVKTKSNCPYYPFFIYKILDHILSSKEDEIRRNKFFSYIYLQLPDTLYEQDSIWKKICNLVPEFTYKHTVELT